MITCDINNYMWSTELLMTDVTDVIIARLMVRKMLLIHVYHRSLLAANDLS